MPRDGATLFGDLIGKLDSVNVACASCSRAGRYQLARLLDDRVPQLADVECNLHTSLYVRFTPKSGHQSAGDECRLCANSRH